MLRRSKSKKKAQAPEAGSGPSGVIVASDDVDVRELLSRVVARTGRDPEQVEDPAGAVAALAAEPRLALLALFGEGRSIDLIDDVRASEEPTVAAVPIIVVTEDDREAKAATVAGADGSLTRPFHADELTGELDTVLGRSAEDRAELRSVAGLSDEG